jgi:hypothetical protein
VRPSGPRSMGTIGGIGVPMPRCSVPPSPCWPKSSSFSLIFRPPLDGSGQSHRYACPQVGQGEPLSTGRHASAIEQPAPAQPWLEAVSGRFREMANGPQVDHRNPVNGCERTRTNLMRKTSIVFEVSGETGPLITVWLKVRVLPGPPVI